MGRVRGSDSATQSANVICKVQHTYCSSLKLSILNAASTYGLSYVATQHWVRGVNGWRAMHRKRLLLTLEAERLNVQFWETLDDLGHLLQVKMVIVFVLFLLLTEWQWQLYIWWMIRFLNHYPAITAKFSEHLGGQEANANKSAILQDFFRKVYYYSPYLHFKLILVTVAWKTW